MSEEIIELLRQNREKLKIVDGTYEQNDYSINNAVDEEFYKLLSEIDLKNIKNKTQILSLIDELAFKTVNKTVKKVSNYDDVTDFAWGHDFRITELYLRDLIDNLLENVGKNIILAIFYKKQIDYLVQDFKTHQWGEEKANKLLDDIRYKEIANSIEKMADQVLWSLYWNEDYKNDKEKIKYAIGKDAREINYVPNSIKEEKEFMLELLKINPECYYGMSSTIKSDRDIAKFIIYEDWRQFVSHADDSLRNEQFLRECNLEEDDIKLLLEAINSQKKKEADLKILLESVDGEKQNTQTNNSQNNNSESKIIFDSEAYKCVSFLEGLNKCNTKEEIDSYVDSIVDGFPYDENTPNTIGTGMLFSRTAYTNGGLYNGFIHPSIKILNATFGYSYHIYDRDYLYTFAYGIRKLNLPNDTNLLPYVMRMLDSYFGFPKDNVDRRDDVLYNFAVAHAEEFYKQRNIPINEQMGAIDQMQFSGDFPLSALRGTYSAQCMERSALAQNIMKLCGYNSAIMYGDCESRGHTEGHCWNAIYDKDGNVMIIDFSNTIFLYKNGEFYRRDPYAYAVSRDEYLAQDGVLEMPDYHYEDGKRLRDSKNRKYYIGKTMSKQKDISTESKSKQI